jgi:hypothetical protein
MALGDRQQDADDDQSYRVGKSQAPERDGRERREQQELQRTDDLDAKAAFMHRRALGGVVGGSGSR